MTENMHEEMHDDVHSDAARRAGALSDALRRSGALRWPPCQDLRQAVRQYAARERRFDVPFNPVRRTVKRMVGEACLREGRHAIRLLLIERAVDWALDGYYRLREGVNGGADASAPRSSLAPSAGA